MRSVFKITRAGFHLLPRPIKNALLAARVKVRRLRQGGVESQANLDAFNDLMRDYEWSPAMMATLVTKAADDLPHIDISAVTHNSQKWIAGFVSTLKMLDYPAEKLHLHFVDNGSEDGTVELLAAAVSELREVGMDVSLIIKANDGFGGGHNVGIANGNSPFVLVTNVDLTFQADALRIVATCAIADADDVATWELRQKPFEHPKVYNPLSGRTNWNSHACVLLRRKAFEAVGGYCSDIFMYGEDVELSYRLRDSGFTLRYIPHAVVTHHTYETAEQTKPIQFIGSSFANLYIRMLYGRISDIAWVIPLMVAFITMKQRFPGARVMLIRSLYKLIRKAPGLLRSNLSRKDGPSFSFAFRDYDFRRRGAFHAASSTSYKRPKITIITRTYAGREAFLRQAMISVANQTYSNIEHLITEDRGHNLVSMVGDFDRTVPYMVRHVGGNKIGRSDAGNVALAQATGDFCVFLDDDDQFYCDHLETLVNAISINPGARIGYALAFDIPCSESNPLDENFRLELPIIHDFMEVKVSERALRSRNYFPIQAVLFDRKLYDERGGFDEDLDMLEDWVLWQKYFYQTDFVYVPKTTSFFRTPAYPQHHASRMKILNASFDTVVTRMNKWRDEWDRNHK